MRTIHRTIAILGGGMAFMGLCDLAPAQITFSSSANLSSWNGSPMYTSISSASLSGATTGQGDATITGTYGVMAEMFTPTTSFTLGSFSILLSVNNLTDSGYQIHLYDLGPSGTVSASDSAATYAPGTDLLSVNNISGLVSGGPVQGIFTLPNLDQITLSANEQYSLELWTPSTDAEAGITWMRLPSNTPSDTGGQMFTSGDGVGGARNTLAGNGQAGGAPRTASLALYSASPVPEPSSLALIGMGGLVGFYGLRRRKI